VVLNAAALVVTSATPTRPARLSPAAGHALRAAARQLLKERTCGYAGDPVPAMVVSADGQSSVLRPWNKAMRFPHRSRVGYTGQCVLCGISASSTPLAPSFVRYDKGGVLLAVHEHARAWQARYRGWVSWWLRKKITQARDAPVIGVGQQG